jgi:hypothetical protein
MGHEEPVPPRSSSDRFGFSQPTSAGLETRVADRRRAIRAGDGVTGRERWKRRYPTLPPPEKFRHARSDLRELAHRRDVAAGNFVARWPEFLNLITRIQAAFSELRSVRLCIIESCGPIHLDGRLLDLAQANQPTGAARYMGHDLDEDLIRVSYEAVTALLRDADAPLPPVPVPNQMWFLPV